MATKKSQFVATIYRCECCDYSTSKIYDFNKHNNTKKHIVNDKSIKSTNLSLNVANVANIENIATIYRCECCDYSTSKICDFNKHNTTKKHIANDNCRKMSLNVANVANVANLSQIYRCECCDYSTSKICDFNKHNSTKKHIANDKSNNLSQENQFICQDCNKTYKDKSGLWRHKKKCGVENPAEIITAAQITPDFIITVLQQHNELQKQMVEAIKNGTNNNTTNSHNKSFNLNFFLNETCKDAMNIMDFVDSIKLTLSDLEKVGEKGYVNGISNIITQNLNSLDETKRPVHCTDSKREVMYIKDDNKWEKENNDNMKLRKVIKEVSHKNVSMLKEFRAKYPECTDSDSRYSDKYNNLIIEAMGGKGDNNSEKEDKIICNIAKEVTIDKTNV